MVHFKYKGISKNSIVHFKFEGTSRKSYAGIDLKAYTDSKAQINLNTMGILVPQKTHKEGAPTCRTNGGLAWLRTQWTQIDSKACTINLKTLVGPLSQKTPKEGAQPHGTNGGLDQP